MLLMMPGLALFTAQSSFDGIVQRPLPASIVDHVLLHVLQGTTSSQRVDDMQPSCCSLMCIVVSPAALSDPG